MITILLVPGLDCGVDVLVERVLDDGHNVLRQTSYRDGRNFYHIEIAGQPYTVADLGEYEHLLERLGQEQPVQLRLFGERIG